jgi:hypothetical protein
VKLCSASLVEENTERERERHAATAAAVARMKLQYKVACSRTALIHCCLVGVTHGLLVEANSREALCELHNVLTQLLKCSM